LRRDKTFIFDAQRRAALMQIRFSDEESSGSESRVAPLDSELADQKMNGALNSSSAARNITPKMVPSRQ